MYTTDGSYPVEWDKSTAGETTSEANLYSKENIAPLLSAGHATLRAISKDGSNWSATITRNVFVIDEQADYVNTIGHSPSTIDNEAIYDLIGREIDNSQLRKGVYIMNGKISVNPSLRGRITFSTRESLATKSLKV